MFNKKKKYGPVGIIGLFFIITPLYAAILTFHTIIYGLLPAVQTAATAYFIDVATAIFRGLKNYDAILLPVLLIVATVFCTNVLPAIMQLIEVPSKNKLNLVLKIELIQKRAKLKYQYVEDKEVWELINRVCGKPGEQFEQVFHTILNMLSLGVTTISLLCIIMSTSIIPGIFILMFSVPFIILSMKTGKENYTLQMDSQKIQRKYNYYADILTKREFAEERYLFGYKKELEKRYDDLCNDTYRLERKIQVHSFLNLKKGSFITMGVAIVILVILSVPLHSGKMSMGLYIALTTAVLNLVQNMSWQLSEIMFSYAESCEYLKDFTLFISLEEKKDADVLPAKNSDFTFQSLEFKNVSFIYPDTEKKVLENCSFKMEKGKSYAFAGENGAGKSTIIKLLTGLYDNYEGEIILNDINIKKYDYGEIKRIMSVVYQDFARYEISVRENIYLGDVTKEDELKVAGVLHDTGLDKKIEALEQGVDTNLGKIRKNGCELSGGEWQRLAIARLLYADSLINIMDEPTAALDPVQESQLYELFRRIYHNRFTVYITHRLAVARFADEILVLSKGQVVEQGSHNVLMKENGLYKKMFDAQKSWYK